MKAKRARTSKRDTGWARGTDTWGAVRTRDVGGWVLSVYRLPSDYPGQRAAHFEWSALGPDGERHEGNTRGLAETVDRIRAAQEAAFRATGLR